MTTTLAQLRLRWPDALWEEGPDGSVRLGSLLVHRFGRAYLAQDGVHSGVGTTPVAAVRQVRYGERQDAIAQGYYLNQLVEPMTRDERQYASDMAQNLVYDLLIDGEGARLGVERLLVFMDGERK